MVLPYWHGSGPRLRLNLTRRSPSRSWRRRSRPRGSP